VTLIVAMGALTIVVTIVIGIVYYKNKKQQRTSVREEFEIPQYADIPSDSRERNTSQISEHYYEVVKESKEYVNVESSSQAPVETSTESAAPHGMTVNVAYGVAGHMM